MFEFNAKVGDVWRMKSGEILKFTEIVVGGLFKARLKGLPGEWTDYYMEGESWKLKPFLKQNEAIKLNPNDHPEPESKRKPQNESR